MPRFLIALSSWSHITASLEATASARRPPAPRRPSCRRRNRRFPRRHRGHPGGDHARAPKTASPSAPARHLARLRGTSGGERPGRRVRGHRQEESGADGEELMKERSARISRASLPEDAQALDRPSAGGRGLEARGDAEVRLSKTRSGDAMDTCSRAMPGMSDVTATAI